MSGVTVPTTMASTSSKLVPWRSTMFFTAPTARSLAGDSLVDKVALVDPGALQNPLIGSVKHLFEIEISEHPRRDIGTQGADFRAF